MDLTAMKVRPAIAGPVARLKFVEVPDSQFAVPTREGRLITLPVRKGSEFFPLQGGYQFLFRCFRKHGDLGRSAYFGGTDEKSAFLTMVWPHEIFEAFEGGGEDGFYDALKPQVLHFWEENLGALSSRQGDFYYLPLPLWNELKPGLSLALQNDLHLKTARSTPIAESRHKITGLVTDEIVYLDEDGGVYLITFGQGILRAPDHQPSQLDCVHLIIHSRLESD